MTLEFYFQCFLIYCFKKAMTKLVVNLERSSIDIIT